MTGVAEMPTHDHNTDDMSDNGGCGRSFDTPSKPLDEDDIAAEVNGIVDEDGDRYQSRAAVDTYHRA